MLLTARSRHLGSIGCHDHGGPIVQAPSPPIALQTRPKRGEHRAHIACHSGPQTHCYDLTFDKGRRTRSQEEAVLASALLRICAYHGGVPEATIPDWPLRAPEGFNDTIESDKPLDMLVDGSSAAATEGRPRAEAGAPGQAAAVQALLDGRVSCVELSGPAGDRRVAVDAPRHNVALLPGSFNPLHKGHRRATARELCHAAVCGTRCMPSACNARNSAPVPMMSVRSARASGHKQHAGKQL